MLKPALAAAIAALAGAALLSACSSGAGGLSATFDPNQTTPTRLTTPDGLVSVLIPTDALTDEVRLVLLNCSSDDAAVPGPTGRNLLLALEFSGTNPPTPATDTAPAGAPTPATLASAVDVTLRIPFSLRTDISLPVYAFNDVSQRYEPASLSATPTPADPLATTSNELKFSINAFGRYAVFSLLPSELPPPVPVKLRLLAASTQVRKLAWDKATDELVVGYNLYRADVSQASVSFTKLNTNALLTGTVYSDELKATGAFRYRVTSVNSSGIESDPSNEVDSPAVVFDVAFTFGKGVLDTPSALAIDSSRDRLVVADTASHQLHVYDLAGKHQSQLEQYPGGRAMDPRGLAYNADGSGLYVVDGTTQDCRVFDPDWKLTGRFGTPGKDPGEFEAPSAVVVVGDTVLVADSSNSTLQVFTPLGVYLSTAATQGATDGLLDAPSALLLGKGGKVYISDANNNRVQSFKAADVSFDKVLDYTPADGGPLVAPNGLAEDFRGWLYISDTGNHRVVVFDNSGKFLYHFGADGALTVEFSTTSGPRGMAIDKTTGYLYVCDPGNHRIAVFKT